MHERILAEIRNIEKLYQVKVCFAVESGSRAWGYPSMGSDFDVRFIYIHRKEWYLSIDEKRDVIELPINEQLDISGWDVRKALFLFRKCNPGLMEWLHSEIVYYQAFSLIEKMKGIEEHVFLPQVMLYHYLNMAKRNFRDILNKEEMQIKAILNVLRPTFACNWIDRHNTVPPTNFQLLLDDHMPSDLIKQEINILLKGKKNGEQLASLAQITATKLFVEIEIERIQRKLNQNHYIRNEDVTPQLNILFRETLEEAWPE